MKSSWWLQWLLALQVLVVLSILGSSIMLVDASSRHLLLQGVTLVELSEQSNSEPSPPGSVSIRESGPAELHVPQNEDQEVREILRKYRPQPRFLAAEKKPKPQKVDAKAGKKTPKGAPPPPQNTRRIALPPPPSPPSIPSCRPPPPSPRKQ
ncbi:hypothetical protein KC19_6G156400 [Ceratodon purpureus]|uniref:Uncharacterized protein n=1 Tax=Ceratodon purpureus TaxID=3225 RepID=A0A8T0HIE4_CERPU|nr:hypothetical protein KC19_6G156400 [Ceratodon purpureus]